MYPLEPLNPDKLNRFTAIRALSCRIAQETGSTLDRANCKKPMNSASTPGYLA